MVAIWSVHSLNLKVFITQKFKPFKNHQERTEKQSEGFYLTPFAFEGGKFSEEFKITAEVIACPCGPAGDQCGFHSDCLFTPNRYDGLSWYPNPNPNCRRRRDTSQSESTIQVIDVYHPCKYVSEDVKVCIVDDNGQPGKGPN